MAAVSVLATDQLLWTPSHSEASFKERAVARLFRSRTSYGVCDSVGRHLYNRQISARAPALALLGSHNSGDRGNALHARERRLVRQVRKAAQVITTTVSVCSNYFANES